jgi:signal transduction histidine kinase
MTFSWLSSLRSRLTASYVAVLVFALAAFGAAAVFVIDRDLHASLDARLQTTARAALNFIDVKSGSINIDARDREQLFALLGGQTQIAIRSDAAGLVFSTATKPAADLLAPPHGTGGFALVRHSGVDVRVLIVPITTDDKHLGDVVVWSSTEWIEDTDRQVAIAFAVAALLLAAVSSITGTLVARRALDDAFARQRRFTTDASHELRAPLSVIRAEADLALRKPRDPATYQNALSTIAAEAEMMEKLVSSLLSAARAQDGSGARAIVELKAVASRVCTRLRPAADVKHVDLGLEGEEDCRVECDGDALERAVTAIVHNAIKYTPSGGRILVSTARHRGNAELRIHDSGPGFSDDALVHASDWFWRGDQEQTNDGTGLGLAIADSIARAAGGHLSLGNAVAGGAQVEISLPAR